MIAQGPPEVVIPAVINFIAAVKAHCNLEVQLSKSELFSWEGRLPENTPEGVLLGGREVDGQFEAGIEYYGVPMGTKTYRAAVIRDRAEEIVKHAVTVCDLLSGERQAMWTALRLSICQRFNYVCQHVPPSITEPVAAWLDSRLWGILEDTNGFEIPRGRRGAEGDLVVEVPVQGLEEKSFQEWVVRLPVRYYGWGFRSAEDICGPAFLGTLEAAIPRMTQICPAMAQVWGVMSAGVWVQLQTTGGGEL